VNTMDDALDFSGLTDEQLTTLLKSGMAEAFRRSPACAAAVRSAYLSEAEKFTIQRDAAAREAERLRQEEVKRCEAEAAAKVRRDAELRQSKEQGDKERRLWGKKKGIAEALQRVGWDVSGDQLVVWFKDTTKERRVFLQSLGYGGITYATLYVTGNRQHPPGTIEWSRNVRESHRQRLQLILEAAARDWTSVKIDLQAALNWNGDAIPVAGIDDNSDAKPESKFNPPSQEVPPTLQREQRGTHGGWYWVCLSCKAWEHESERTRIRHSSRCDHKDAQPPEHIAAA
jgi:hypothetical protein